MKPVLLMLIAACVFAPPAFGDQVLVERVVLPGEPPPEVFLRKRIRGEWVRPTPVYKPSSRPLPQEEVWKIPQGKFGLEFKDNLRMIGRPAKGWSVTLKTGFGTVTIPLAQVNKLEPAGEGKFAAHLRNGDRVTGELVSKTLAFETDYGTLTVPSSELVRFSTAKPVQPTVPGSTTPVKTQSGPREPPTPADDAGVRDIRGRIRLKR